MLVSIAIPCYNSELSIRKVVEETTKVFNDLPGYECEFVLVNDSSKDGTYREICRLAEEYDNVHGISFARNFGQQNALMCALRNSSGELIVGMDDDLQCHPSQIPIMLKKIEEGYDLVYGVFQNNENRLSKKFTHFVNVVTEKRLLGKPEGVEFSNYWIITKRVRDEVVKYKGFAPKTDALFIRSTSNIACVPIRHFEREHGTSNYTFWKLVKLWLAYLNYSVLPLRIISGMGVAMAFIGVIWGILLIFRRILSPTDIPSGWASIMCVLLFFFGCILLALGVLGEYLGNIVMSVNGTPQYVEESRTDSEPK